MMKQIISQKGFTLIETLISSVLGLVVFLSFSDFAITTYKLQDKMKALENISDSYNGIRLALSNRAFCNSAFKYNGSNGTFNPNLSSNYSQIDEILLSGKTLIKTGELLPSSTNVRVNSLKLEPLLPLKPVVNNDRTTSYQSILTVNFKREGQVSSEIEKRFLTTIVIDASFKITSCFTNGTRIQKAQANRLALNFAGPITQVGCSVTNWSTSSQKKRYLRNACTDVTKPNSAGGLDPVQNGICDSSESGSNVNYPERWVAVKDNPNYACHINPGPANSSSVSDGFGNNFDWCYKDYFPYPYTQASRRKMYWELYFPTLFGNADATVEKEINLYRRLSPNGPLVAKIPKRGNIPFGANAGRCPVGVQVKPENELSTDVFFIPTAGAWRNHLALGCRADKGWFITGCSRANDGNGKTTAQIIVDSTSGNQLCVTDDFIYPHVDYYAWQNMMSVLNVLCVRMDQ